MLSSIELALKSLIPVLEPVALQEFENALIPELQKLGSGIGSPDLKLIAGAMITALQTIGAAEIPKV